MTDARTSEENWRERESHEEPRRRRRRRRRASQGGGIGETLSLSLSLERKRKRVEIKMGRLGRVRTTSTSSGRGIGTSTSCSIPAATCCLSLHRRETVSVSVSGKGKGKGKGKRREQKGKGAVYLWSPTFGIKNALVLSQERRAIALLSSASSGNVSIEDVGRTEGDPDQPLVMTSKARTSEGPEKRRRGRVKRVAFVLLAVAAGYFLVCFSNGSLFAHASENPVPDGSSPLLKHPLVKFVCCFGVIKGIHKQREYLKTRAASATRKALKRIKRKRIEAICIPFVAAFVGWLTNWLAVQMLFYPVEFMGLQLGKRQVVNTIYGCDVFQPLGLIGWQGIVPAKAAKMGYAMVNMVTTKLINVQEVFGKIDGDKIATLLSIEVPDMARDIGKSLFPNWTVSLAENQFVPKLTSDLKYAILEFQHSYLSGFVRHMQANLSKILDMDQFITQYYCSKKWLLNKFFQQCGEKELDFLVKSGVWFGFLLGLPQIVLWAFVDNIWSLVFGGLVVGYATNWLALKLIFEPVEPLSIGPFTIQGIFLQRQQEVSVAFAEFYATWILKSKLIWHYLFTGPKSESFKELLTDYNVDVINEVANKLSVRADLVDPDVVRQLGTTGAERILEELPKHVDVLHNHIDATLDVQPLLEKGLQRLSPKEFESVLHPIFEEEEIILIIAGAILGAAAGALQYIASEVIRSEARKRTNAAEAKAKGEL